jgi:choline dehydrogenase-like flavoprotein
MLQDPGELQKVMQEYMTSRTGPTSSGGSASAFAAYADFATPDEIAAIQKSVLENTENAGGNHTAKVRQILADDLGKVTDGSIQMVILPASTNVERFDTQTEFLSPPKEMLGKQGLTLGPCVARPISVESCHVVSSIPVESPTIDPGYLTHQADVELLGKGLEIAEMMAATSPFKDLIKRRFCPDESVDLKDKKQREEYVSAHCGTEYHPIGTVSMGRQGEGAVDERLRVWGVKGVRVVDASVIPLQASGNIVSDVYAAAEKGSDLIKEDWGALRRLTRQSFGTGEIPEHVAYQRK